MKNKSLLYQKDSSYKDSPECQQILQWIGSQKRILEVGCHTADLGVVLKGNGNFVVGIDYNENAISIAKTKIQEAYVVDLESIEPYLMSNELYDVIVCNQVLEHLRNPEIALKRLLNLLQPSGTIIIGLPNVCNAKDRFNITWGQWEYTKTGVMDETHVHFFSYNSAISMIEDAGLVIKDYHCSWKVNPIWEFLDHIPVLCKCRGLFNEHKPMKCFSHNATDVVMIFKCER